MKIWKYELPKERGSFYLRIPVGWQRLDVQIQDGKPVMWCAVDEEADIKIFKFEVLFTGDDFLPGYMATFQIGPIVYHLFIT